MQDKSRVCGLKRNLSVGDRAVPWIVDHAMHGGENIGLCGPAVAIQIAAVSAKTAARKTYRAGKGEIERRISNSCYMKSVLGTHRMAANATQVSSVYRQLLSILKRRCQCLKSRFPHRPNRVPLRPRRSPALNRAGHAHCASLFLVLERWAVR